jgi:diguanylate cyclase (GGDEF)-like protein
MQDDLSNDCIRKFIEEYECTKRTDGEPCRMNGASLLKILKKNDFENILKRMQSHEDYWRKIACVQEKIFSISTMKDFFDLLLPEARKAFEMPYMWLTVIESSTLDELVKEVMTKESQAKNIGFMKSAKFKGFFKNETNPVIVSKYAAPYTSFFPEKSNYTVNSMVIMPLRIDGTLVGSLNLGHFVSNRFVPEMDTNLIRQFVLTVSLCLSKIAAQEKIKFLEYHDSLTSLLNRTSLEAELEREFARSSRHRKDLTVIFFEIDGIKELNDQYGHDYGEMAVKYVAEILKSQCRMEDTAGRFSGDEFALILPESTASTSKVLMKRIQDYLDENPFDYKEIKFQLSLNHGAASIDRNRNFETARQLLKAAYAKLISSKPLDHRQLKEVNSPVVYNIRAI